MEATQQMNIRISPTLKKEGDTVLARLGLSPSEAVRRFYESLVRNQDNQRALDEIVGVEGASDEAAAERERKRKELLEFPERVKKFYADLGIDPSKSRLATANKEELREIYVEAIEERMRERGLL